MLVVRLQGRMGDRREGRGEGDLWDDNSWINFEGLYRGVSVSRN